MSTKAPSINMEDMMFVRGLEKNRSEQPPSNPLKAMCWILLGKGKFVCVHVGVRRLRGETYIFFCIYCGTNSAGHQSKCLSYSPESELE